MAYQSKYKGHEVEEILDNSLLKKEQILTDNEKRQVKENLGIKDQDLSDYATKKEVEDAISKIPTPDVSGQINEHNNDESAHPYIQSELEEVKNSVPSKVSQLENDSKFATESNVADLVKAEFEKLPEQDVSGQIASALVDYVKKVEGKGLSTNDFTNELKTKLEGITPYDPSELEAEIGKLETALNTLVGGNASNAIESFNEIIAFLTNVSDKETLGGIIAGINTRIAEVEAKIPTKVSELENDKNYLTEHQSLSHLATKDELNTKQDKIEDLDAIREGASRTIPTKTSELNNDSGFLTEHQDITHLATKKEVEEAIKNIPIPDVSDQLKTKASNIAVIGTTVYLFASQEDKEKFLNTGEATYLDTAKMELVDKVIEITNLSGDNNPYITSDQTKAEISVSWRSLAKPVASIDYTEVYEDAVFSVEIDRGNTGTWETVESGRSVRNGDTFTIDVRKYLAVGANRIIIKAVGSNSKATGQINITVNLTSMYIKPANFTWYLPIIEGKDYQFGGFEIGGNLSKTFHIKVSGNGYDKAYNINMGTDQYINTAYYTNAIDFPSTGTGVYDVEIWLESQSLETQHLHYKMMFVAEQDITTAQMVVVSSVAEKVVNYSDNTIFQYATYNQSATISSPHVLVKATVKGKEVVVVDETMADVITGSIQSYILPLEIESDDESFPMVSEISFGNVVSMDYVVDNSLSFPATSGAVLYMNPATRSNAQENREKIINVVNGEEINATFTNVAFADEVDGYTVDDKGRKCLFLPAKTKVVVDAALLSSLGNGKAIEFNYKVKNVADYNEPIITVCDNPSSDKFRGIKIRPTNVLLHSRDLNESDMKQGIDVNEEEEINAIISIVKNYKVTYGNLAQIFINGCTARSFEFSGTDSWVTDGKLILGSDTADLYIYPIRVYERGFEKMDAEKNYVSSLADSLTKQVVRNRIDSVRDDKGNISFDKCNGMYNTMLVRMRDGAELPHYGLSKEYNAQCDVTFSFVDLPSEFVHKAWKFVIENVRIEGQGTTSMNYYLWNLRFRIDKSKNVIIVYLEGNEIGTINI